MYYLIAIFNGILLAIMVLLNGDMGTAYGNYNSSVLIHFIGLIGIIVVLFATKSKMSIKHISPFLFSGGAIGVLTVLFSNVGYQFLGISMTLALGLLGQTISSMIIDEYGLLGMKVEKFNRKKIIGVVFIIAGIIVMMFV